MNESLTIDDDDEEDASRSSSCADPAQSEKKEIPVNGHRDLSLPFSPDCRSFFCDIKMQIITDIPGNQGYCGLIGR